MALLSSVLSSGLAFVFQGVDNFATAGEQWAQAYASYAQTAQANGVPPVFTGLEQETLSAALAAAFAAGQASEGSALLPAIEAALIGFWMGPPVVFGIGVTTLAPPGVGALIGATFAANLASASTSECAERIAGVLDSWTRSIVVTFPGTPPILATLL